MRNVILAAAAVVATSLMPATGHAQTSPYRWCAVLNMGDAAYNCGFTTIEQCRATVSGIGGYCEINPFYVEALKRRDGLRAARTEPSVSRLEHAR